MKKVKKKKHETSFLRGIEKSNEKRRPTLAFFIAFSPFIYSDTVQMTLVMKDIASVKMALVILTIGIVLAFVTLLLSLAAH